MSAKLIAASLVALLICAPAHAQERLQLELIPNASPFQWSGTSTISQLVAFDFDQTYQWMGTLELEVTQGPNGPQARFDGGSIAFSSDLQASTITALFGTAEYLDTRIALSSPNFDLGSFTPFQTDLTLTFTQGTLNLASNLGPATSTPLAGQVIGTIPVSGSMGITALGEYQLNLGLFPYQLDFSTGQFSGSILSTGFATAKLTCPLGSAYCVSSTNSIGTQPRMGLQGLPSVAQNNLTLGAYFLPSNTPGVFFYGDLQSQLPFGDGFRCIGSPAYRLQVIASNSNGQAFYDIDVSAPPTPAALILPGSTWNFQFWYRDPGGPGGTGFNLTDGVEVFFCP